MLLFFFFSSRRRHTRLQGDWSSDVCSSDLGTPDDLERGLELPYRVNLKVKGSGNFYFLCRLDVTTLNDTDLEELTRWLKGDVSPAVSGGGNLGGALARGPQRLLVRIAGLPRLTLEARFETFNRTENYEPNRWSTPRRPAAIEP